MQFTPYRLSMRNPFAHLAIATVFVSVSGAAASVIQIGSDIANATEGIAAFTGSLEYTSDAFSNSGSLVINLTNTSEPSNGGFITGLVFNLPSLDPNASSSMLFGSNDFQEVNNENAAPFGTFDTGAALHGNWLGGGPPQGGIAVGQTGSFEFLINATDAASLSAEDFITGGNGSHMAIRFRGFADGGSDKVPTMLVPAPAAMNLLLVVGLIGTRRRRRR